MSEPMKYALCALAYFRARHVKRPKYRSGRRLDQTISARRRNAALARLYVRRARAAGWRGSVRAALGVT